MRVKICGITQLEDARYCAGAGADYLGFIQHAASPRFVDPSVAKEIVSWIHGPEPVGVFVDAPIDTVNRVAADVGFALVQLHGNESPAYCAEIEAPIIRALRVYPNTTEEQIRREIDTYAGVAAHILLDTGKAGMAGGTGTTFDWSLAGPIAEDYPIFLAGGITPGNVMEAAERVRPFAVDASSGLESAPGRKDIDLLNAFFDAVRAVDA